MSAANQQIIQSIMQTGYTPTNLGTLLVNTCTNHYSKKILTLLCKIKRHFHEKREAEGFEKKKLFKT